MSTAAVLMILQLFAAAAGAPGGGVLLHVESHQVVLDNGVVQVWVSKPQGQITAVRYGDDPGNLLHFTGRSATGVMNSGGYWDLIWNFPGPGRPEGMTDVWYRVRSGILERRASGGLLQEHLRSVTPGQRPAQR